MWTDILMITPIVLFALIMVGSLGAIVFLTLRDMYKDRGFFKGIVIPIVVCVLVFLFCVWFATGLKYVTDKHLKKGHVNNIETSVEKPR